MTCQHYIARSTAITVSLAVHPDRHYVTSFNNEHRLRYRMNEPTDWPTHVFHTNNDNGSNRLSEMK